MNYIQGVYLRSVRWTVLSIDIPKENEQTMLAVEQMFAQFHSMHINRTFGERVFYGMFQLWLSFEIVSFGGQIRYLAHIPSNLRNLVEAAIYAQFPNAEINEVEDYMKNVPDYNPETSHYEIWGTEFKLKKEDAYPIRTYRAFEHQASQVIVDPLAGVLESLSAIEPYELMAVQYQIRPTDDKWKEAGLKLIKELKGDPEKPSAPNAVFDIMGRAFSGLLDMVGLGGGAGEAEAKKPDTSLLLGKMAFLTPGERDAIAAIEMNLSKIGYFTKIRVLYMAPKEKFAGEKKAGIVGAFRQFDDVTLNGIKPDMKVWLGKPFQLSRTLEQPYINWVIRKRKKYFMKFFRTRMFLKGSPPFIFNIEELATIFHFPLINVKAPQMVKAEIRKGEAPINLPVG